MSSVYDTPEWAAWLASIKEMPDDDNRRLVAADFLEENGEGERAGLIRKMCEKHTRYVEFGPRDVGGGMWIWDPVKRSMPTWFKWKATCRRVAKLALKGLHTTEWRSMSVRLHRGFVSRVSGPLVSLIGGRGCNRCVGGGREPTDRHGNVYVGECPDCNGTGRTPGVLRELVRREPVAATGIEVTDREPRYAESVEKWHWVHEGNPHAAAGRPDTLPVELWETDPISKPILQPAGRRAARWFDSEDTARAALSAALLRLVQPVEVPT